MRLILLAAIALDPARTSSNLCVDIISINMDHMELLGFILLLIYAGALGI